MFAFRAMNTEVTVDAPGPDEAAIAERVAAAFWHAEQRFSRFDPDSELSQLNRAEAPMQLSPELFDVLVRARGHVERTGGLFDPGVGAALVALGYDRSVAPGALDRAQSAAAPRAGHLLEVHLDAATRTALRPPHVHIDLGGLVKGATVDAAAVHLGASGTLDAGGDAVLRGGGPDGTGWLVELEDPHDASRALLTLRLADTAVATSAGNRRRWQVAGASQHHLIDPRTQRAASTDLVQATVVAPSAELADVLAKTAFLLGARAARDFLAPMAGSGVGAVLVPARGAPVLVGALDVVEDADG